MKDSLKNFHLGHVVTFGENLIQLSQILPIYKNNYDHIKIDIILFYKIFKFLQLLKSGLWKKNFRN